jgi:hypothetical protein
LTKRVCWCEFPGSRIATDSSLFWPLLGNDAIKAFTGIYGVGKLVAARWYDKGLRSLQDVKEGKFGHELTVAQQIGLEHYHDLQKRIPRAEVTLIYDAVIEAAKGLDPKLVIECMGSYRRGQEDCLFFLSFSFTLFQFPHPDYPFLRRRH